MSYNKTVRVIAAAALAVFTATASAQDFTSTKKGDVNDDKLVTLEDAELIAKHIIGQETLTGQALQNADFNGDSEVNVTDILALITMLKDAIPSGGDNNDGRADAPVRD